MTLNNAMHDVGRIMAMKGCVVKYGRGRYLFKSLRFPGLAMDSYHS